MSSQKNNPDFTFTSTNSSTPKAVPSSKITPNISQATSSAVHHTSQLSHSSPASSHAYGTSHRTHMYTHPNSSISSSIPHPLCFSDLMNKSNKSNCPPPQSPHLTYPQRYYPSNKHPRNSTMTNSFSPSTEVDSKTGIPLSVLNNLRELLPPVSNCNSKNKPLSSSIKRRKNDDIIKMSDSPSTTQMLHSPSKLDMACRSSSIDSNAGTPSAKTYTSISLGNNTKLEAPDLTTPTSYEKSIPAHTTSLPLHLRIQNENTISSNAGQNNANATSNHILSPETSSVTSKTPQSSTDSLIQHLKDINEQLHKSIIYKNMFVYSLESQIKKIENDSQFYYYSIDELNAQLETEKRLRKRLQGFTADLYATDQELSKYDKVTEKKCLDESPNQKRQKRNESTSTSGKRQTTEYENAKLLKQIENLEKEIHEEKQLAQNTFSKMKGDLLHECDMLIKVQERKRDELLSENQKLLDTNKILMEKLDQTKV